MSNRFQSKTYGRIFVASEEDKKFVIDAIDKVDDFESAYLGKDVVAVLGIGEAASLVYTHKFEIDIDELTFYCWTSGVRIWCVTGMRDEFSWNPNPEKKQT
jgi:hypothetical protein